MDQKEIEKRVAEFLKSLGVPAFIIFGWQKADKEFGVVSSQHKMPPKVAIKGISWALNDVINRNL